MSFLVVTLLVRASSHSLPVILRSYDAVSAAFGPWRRDRWTCCSAVASSRGYLAATGLAGVLPWRDAPGKCVAFCSFTGRLTCTAIQEYFIYKYIYIYTCIVVGTRLTVLCACGPTSTPRENRKRVYNRGSMPSRRRASQNLFTVVLRVSLSAMANNIILSIDIVRILAHRTISILYQIQ